MDTAVSCNAHNIIKFKLPMSIQIKKASDDYWKEVKELFPDFYELYMSLAPKNEHRIADIIEYRVVTPKA